MPLPKVGAEAVIEGMAKYEADAKKVNQGFLDMDAGASKLGKGATGLTTSLGSLGASILNIGVVAGGVALAGVTAFAAGLATFAVGGIKQAIDLDQQVANIAATMGATQETAGTLKEELKGLALDLSLNPNLTVDVTQAGQAIEVLAANGALAVDEFGRLTQGSKDLAVQTVALANATGSDFATAATIATDAASLFGLKTDEMGKAVDGAAGIMNASKFDANDYQLALAAGGAVTAGFGVSLEEFNTVIASTASSFASGSDAGTSFKTLMQRLANPTDAVKGLMDELGISLFDSEGKFRGMDVVVGQLHEAFTGMTDAQRAETAAVIGGADASRILLALTGQTSDQFNTLSESVNRSGQGLEAAALRVDTVKGAMDIFKGVLQAIQIQVGDKFLPLLKEMAVQFTQFATQNGPMIVEFFGQVADKISQVAIRAGELFAAFQAGGFTGLATALSIPPEVIAGIQNVIAEVMRLVGLFKEGGLAAVFADFKISLQTAANDAIAQVPTLLGNLLAAVSDYFRNNWPTIQAALNEWAGKFFEWVADVSSKVPEKLGPFVDSISAWLTSPEVGAKLNAIGKTIADSLIAGIINAASNVDTLSRIGGAIALGIGLAIAGVTASLVLVGAQIVAGIWSGLLEHIGITLKPAAISELGTMLKDIGSNLMIIATELGKRIVTGIGEGVTATKQLFRDRLGNLMDALAGLDKVAAPYFEAIWETAKDMLKPAKWMELGASIIEGIEEGIKENQDKVLEMLKALAADALQAAKDAIGWGSPAREFLTIGESMVQGMLVGANSVGFAKQFIDDLNMGGIARSLGTGGGQWRNFRNIIKNQIGSSFEQLMTSGMSPAEIINQIQQVATRFNFPPSFASEFAMANGLIEHLTSSVTEFQQAMRLENMGKMAQIGGQFSSLGQAFVDMLKPVNEEKMQILQDFLSGKVAGRMFAHPLTGALTEMVVLQQDGLEVALNRSLAQQELNKLLVEQRRQEELITQQKEAQQKLSFLQAQLDLIKLGKELGGNIFRGITFGLNASVTDLLAATNNVVEAMIGQINEDLQIASPSKVMARIGQQMMAGLQGGLLSMAPILNAQLSASVAGPISPLMAGAMGGGGSSSTIHNWNLGGNTISSGMSEAEFDARVLRTIRRAL